MRLSELIPTASSAAGTVPITGLAYDTRTVEPGTLFFCVPGFTRDGHEFAPDAIARGAAALVVERP
ncbi:MAG TPA: Mur ligase domain-containing protein, partial [Solirubrobacteraceae bacterium]|nr:Mur ligase domain-containing protein [Solirubrobacteraceae bacterium]